MPIMLRKYGKFIYTPETMCVSSNYWFDRQNPSAFGQDVAECYAAMVERMVAYMIGIDDSEFYSLNSMVPIPSGSNPITDMYLAWFGDPSNYDGETSWDEYEGTHPTEYDPIAGFIAGETEEDKFYGKHVVNIIPFWTLMYKHILVSLRNMLIPNDKSNPKVFWLTNPQPPENEDVFAECEIEWTLEGSGYNRSYVPTCTKAWSDILTTGTIIPTEDIETQYVIVPKQVYTPIKDLLYPDVELDPSKTVFGSRGNWWEEQDLGKSVGKLWCESRPSDDVPTEVFVSRVGGGGFTSNKLSVTIGSKGGEAEITVTSGNLEPDILLAGLYQVITDGLSPVFFVISDEGDTGAVIMSHKVIDLSPGGSVVFSYSLKTQPAVGKSFAVAISKQGNGFNISGTTQHIFNRSNWNVPKLVDVTASSSSLVDQCGLLVVDNYIDPLQYVAVRVEAEENYEYEGLSVQPSLATVSKGGFENFVITMPDISIPPVYWEDSRMVQEQLEDARKMANGMIRTGMWIQPAYVKTKSRMEKSYQKSVTKSDSPNEFPTAEDMWDLGYAGLTTNTTNYSDPDGYVSFGSLLQDHRSTAMTSVTTDTVEGTSTTAALANIRVDSVKNTEVILPYPCKWHYDNRLVKSVRIYAITTNSLPSMYGPSPIIDPDGSFTQSNMHTTAYDDLYAGDDIPKRSKHQPFNSTDGAVYQGFYQEPQAGISEYILSLVAEDGDSPTKQPTFDLGNTTAIDPGFGNIVRRTEVTPTYHIGAYRSWYTTINSHEIRNRIVVLGFWVEVGWNFEHLVEGEAFAPDNPNNPKWLSPESSS